jgi:hypothetical protein
VEPFLPADIGCHSWDTVNPPGIYNPDMLTELKNHPLFSNENLKPFFWNPGPNFISARLK